MAGLVRAMFTEAPPPLTGTNSGLARTQMTKAIGSSPTAFETLPVIDRRSRPTS